MSSRRVAVLRLRRTPAGKRASPPKRKIALFFVGRTRKYPCDCHVQCCAICLFLLQTMFKNAAQLRRVHLKFKAGAATRRTLTQKFFAENKLL